VLVIVIGTGVFQNAVSLLQLVLAARELSGNRPEPRMNLLWRRYAEISPPISLLVPAYNEELSIVESLRSMLALNYPNFEILAINDGSKDGTLQAVIDGFGLEPVVRPYEDAVLHKPIRGFVRVAALSQSAPHRQGERRQVRRAERRHQPVPRTHLLRHRTQSSRAMRSCAPCSPSSTNRPARSRSAARSASRTDAGSRAGASCASACRETPSPCSRRSNTCAPSLMARLAWSRLKVLIIISGAFGLFRRQVAVAVGGYSHNTVGEDFELVLKIHRYMRERKQSYLVTYIPEPVCWTEAPESLRVLGRQRSRWQRGALESFFRHIDVLLRPRRYGRVGWAGMGNVLVVDVLGPPVEVLGYILIPLMWGSASCPSTTSWPSSRSLSCLASSSASAR
jgi:cellulose synthase/poly-beta-1,6-N-acetylglucosamine synthase-like glycosyltransferase